MFISSAEKQQLFDRIHYLENNIRSIESNVRDLVSSLQNLNAKAPYGRCKDGTPRAKPGMKTGQKKAVTK